MEQIKFYRHANNLTQEHLANILGVTKAAVSAWEKGKRNPDSLMLRKLAALFECMIDDLLNEPQQPARIEMRRVWRAKVHRIKGKAKTAMV